MSILCACLGSAGTAKGSQEEVNLTLVEWKHWPLQPVPWTGGGGEIEEHGLLFSIFCRRQTHPWTSAGIVSLSPLWASYQRCGCLPLLGGKSGMSKEGWPSWKRFKLMSKPHLRHAPVHHCGAFTDILQNNLRDFSSISVYILGAQLCQVTLGSQEQQRFLKYSIHTQIWLWQIELWERNVQESLLLCNIQLSIKTLISVPSRWMILKTLSWKLPCFIILGPVPLLT